MSLAYGWRIFCETEDAYVSGTTASSSVPPTVCFNNAADTVAGDPIRDEALDTGNTTGVFSVSKSGSDTPLLNQPWLTLGAALTAAAALAPAPVVIQVGPGTYDETGLTPVANTEIVGTARGLVRFEHSAGGNESIFVIDDTNITLRNLTIVVTTAESTNATINGVAVTQSALGTFRMVGCSVTVDDTGCPSGDHSCVRGSSTGTATGTGVVDGCQLTVVSAGTGAKRGLVTTTGPFRVVDTVIEITGSATDIAGIETTAADGDVTLTGCRISAAPDDIIVTDGAIRVDASTQLANVATASTPFTITNPRIWEFGDPGELPSGGWLYRGTTQSGTVNEVEYRVAVPMAVCAMHVSAKSNIDGAISFTLYKRSGANPAATTAVTCSLASGELTASDTAHVASYDAGDYLSVLFDRASASIIDVVVQLHVF